jgi:ParB-like chromosome segregation protein Spo0J
MGAQQMAERIQLWPVDKLIPYARNARLHPQSQIDAIARSIRELGFNNPILVDGDSGILAGHGRLKAAIQIGMTQVPVIPLDHLSEAQRRAYVLVDNRTAEMARWDDGLLADEIARLEAEFRMDFDGLGWSAEELDDLKAALEEAIPVETLAAAAEAGAAQIRGAGAGANEPETDGEVRQDQSFNEFLEGYRNKATKALMLEYPLDEFAELVEILRELRERNEVSSNAEIVAKLIREAI